MRNPRPLLCRALAGTQGNLDLTLAGLLPDIDPRQQAWVRDLLYGSHRWLISIDWILERRLRKPLGKKDQDIRWLLRLAVYQLLWGQTAVHHVVSESVEAARLLRKERLSGLVNGVLRGVLREQESALDQAPEHVRLAHPGWLLAELQTSYPQHWQGVVTANNQKGPMCLRVDLGRTTREAVLAQLADAGLSGHAGRLAPSSIYLQSATEVSRLPGFDGGLISVQDEAAQLAGLLLPPVPAGRVLDACAAPGGKTLHLLEAGWDELLALEIDAQRRQRIDENLARCRRTADIRVTDAARPQDWWDGQAFDGILLDAPCSGSGVIRRHPDIKLQRSATDIARLADAQQALLAALWPLLKPGRQLLYATCSVLDTENNGVITQFLADHDDARADSLMLDGALQGPHGIQLLPNEAAQDGFYYARLTKTAQHAAS